jgi:hypothetical protein
MVKRAVLTAFVLLSVTAAACSDDKKRSEAAARASTAPASPAASDVLNPADFGTNITNPLFALSSLRNVEFSGTERDAEGDTIKTRSVKRLLDKTDTIAGVTVAVLEVKDYEDGELIELTEDYFAQHRDGTVWYFGERVSDYEDGKVVGHEGQWLAGEGNNKPGLFMPASPTVGQEFEQERAPGLAEDRSKVLQLDVELTVPAGKFTGCMKTEDYAPLDKKTELKFYCPRAGLVREEWPGGSSELVRLS